MKTNTETVSEKRKRGRPQSLLRESFDRNHRGALRIEGCQRTKSNAAYRTQALKAVFSLPDDEQTILLGCTSSQLRAGKGTFPPGWDTAANEIGRFLVAFVPDEDERTGQLQTAVNSRRLGISWRDIGAHYRVLRLGKRSGSVDPLLFALCRALDDYRLKFPATSEDTVVSAVNALLRLVET